MNEMTPIIRKAKLFWSGRSQAVRLPKEFRFDGDEVRIRREGDKVVLEPADHDAGWIARVAGTWDADAAAAALDRPGPEAMPEGPVLD